MNRTSVRIMCLRHGLPMNRINWRSTCFAIVNWCILQTTTTSTSTKTTITNNSTAEIQIDLIFKVSSGSGWGIGGHCLPKQHISHCQQQSIWLSSLLCSDIDTLVQLFSTNTLGICLCGLTTNNRCNRWWWWWWWWWYVEDDTQPQSIWRQRTPSPPPRGIFWMINKGATVSKYPQHHHHHQWIQR